MRIRCGEPYERPIPVPIVLAPEWIPASRNVFDDSGHIRSDKITSMDAARVLAAARRRAGLTQRELAELAGTSGPTLSAYESGRVTPRVDTLVRIVRAAGSHLEPALAASSRSDPRLAPPGEQLWQAMLLAEQLPQRTREQRPAQPHAVFGR